MTGARAVLALGSNLGDRLAHLQAGLDLLAAHELVAVDAVSPVYETEPVGGPPQPAYLNAVALLSVQLRPAELLEALHEVEAGRGRERAQPWGPRTLDLDLVTVAANADPAVAVTMNADADVAVTPHAGSDVAAASNAGSHGSLTLPHPRAHERAFVLRPWLDVDPSAVLPGRGGVAVLLAGLAEDGVRRRDDLLLRPPA